MACDAVDEQETCQVVGHGYFLDLMNGEVLKEDLFCGKGSAATLGGSRGNSNGDPSSQLKNNSSVVASFAKAVVEICQIANRTLRSIL
jgi:hypothetical protein